MSTFEDFWAAYPRKTAKVQAIKAWNRAINNRGVKPEVIMAGAQRYRDWLGQRTDKVWRPEPCHAATWLNGDRWDDVLAPETHPRPSYGPRGVFKLEPPLDPAVQNKVGRLMREFADKLRADGVSIRVADREERK